MSDDVWSSLAALFDTHSNDPSRLDPGAADNVLVAWPVLLRILRPVLASPSGKRVLDFGCGTGGFCQKLSSLGLRVTGVEPSEAMLAIARAKTDAGIQYALGSHKSVPERATFDAVVSIMVFQFLADPAPALRALVSSLIRGGLLALVVQNPEYALRWSARGEKFTLTEADGKRALMHFGKGRDVPVFLREASEYDDILVPLGLEKIAEEVPPFTEAYLRLYGQAEDPKVSDREFLVLGYRKR